MVEGVTDWIQEVNAKERANQCVKRFQWWTKELNDLKRQVQKSKKVDRKHERTEVNMRKRV